MAKQSTGKYLRRSLGYLLRLTLLICGIYALMWLSGSTRVSAEAFWTELFTSDRGLLLWGVVVVVAALYPLYGFVTRTIKADAIANNEEIHRAFIVAGYTKNSPTGGDVTTFRASAPLRKLLMFGEDAITVTDNHDGTITLDGIRKQVVQIEFRIHTFVDYKAQEQMSGQPSEGEIEEAEVIEEREEKR